MSKVANMLNMINLLSDGKIHSMKEIAKIIEVTPRMIKQYKNELEQAGIYVESKRGIYGGYSLNSVLNNIDVRINSTRINKAKRNGRYFKRQ